MKEVVVIGYSGHSMVVCDILQVSGRKIAAYCDNDFKGSNIFGLEYWGAESSPENIARLPEYDYFVAIGDNIVRRKIVLNLMGLLQPPMQVVHPTAIVSPHAIIEAGVMLGARCVVNSLARVGLGTICNTGSIIEHDCSVGNFCHIAPSAVLCGNVTVGDGTLIGASAVVRPNIRIGKNVTVGAGAVVLSDLPDGVMVVGNPARIR